MLHRLQDSASSGSSNSVNGEGAIHSCVATLSGVARALLAFLSACDVHLSGDPSPDGLPEAATLLAEWLDCGGPDAGSLAITAVPSLCRTPS